LHIASHQTRLICGLAGSDSAFDANPQADRPDRWHVAGEQEISNLAMAQLVASIVGKPLRYRLVDFHAVRPGHDRRYALDASKLAAAGWKQPMDFAESLERTVRWTLANREWLA